MSMCEMLRETLTISSERNVESIVKREIEGGDSEGKGEVETDGQD